MIIYLGFNGVLGKRGNEFEVMPSALESVKFLQSYKEIEIKIVATLSKDEMLWIKNHFPGLEVSTFEPAKKIKMNGDVLIDVENHQEVFGGKFISFDPRNPHFSWKNAIKEVKKDLKNNRELILKADWFKGVELINNSKVRIKKIVLDNSSYEFTDEGPIVIEGDSIVCENVEPGESILISKTSMYKHESVTVSYCEWEDGQFIENLYITTPT